MGSADFINSFPIGRAAYRDERSIDYSSVFLWMGVYDGFVSPCQ
jgi:hypothetical protein